MEASPLRFLLKKLISHTRHLHSRLRRRDIFLDSKSSESTVYKHVLKFQRPTTIKYRDQPINSASFIGKIIYPLKEMNTRAATRLGVHTMLDTLQSSPNCRSIMIMISMWNGMAELSMQHLKPNDFVYVWGHLESYTKSDQNGKPKIFYKVDVKEINYVARDDQGLNFHESERIVMSGEDRMEKYRNKLHLWQVFFSSPHEWRRDYRKNKKNPKYPDFKHKDGGESLWLDPQDPPWIKRQLQLIDSRMEEQGLEYYGSSSLDLSSMIYDHAENVKPLKKREQRVNTI